MRRLISIAKFEAAIPHRKPGYAEAVLAVAKRASPTHLSVSDEDYIRLNAQYNPRPSTGPGTELKKLLKMIGITATPNCQCNQRAKVMDERGCDWCEENIETICEWLKEEANKRGMLFVKTAVKLLVRRAISNARAVASKE